MTKRTGGLVAAVVLGLLSTGCDGGGVIDLRDDLYAVHSLLVAGAYSVTARVTRNDPRLPLSDEGVEGALVRLVHGTDTITFREAPIHPDLSPDPDAPSGWHRAEVPGGIVPGESYELLVELPTGTAHGTNRPLEPPRILAPEASRIEMGEAVTLPVELSAPAAAGGAVAVRAVVLYGEDGVMAEPRCRFGNDRGSDRPPPPVQEIVEIHIPRPVCVTEDGRQRAPWDSLDVRLIAAVYDSTYIQYAETTFEAGGAYLPYASAGIQGAMGYFASGARASLPLRIVNSESAVAAPDSLSR